MTGFNPFWWAEMPRAPLSGDVNQRIVTSWLSPAVTVNYQGNLDMSAGW